MDRGRGNRADWEAEGKAVGETMRSQTGGPVSEHVLKEDSTLSSV